MYYVITNAKGQTLSIYPATCSDKFIKKEVAYLKAKHGIINIVQK